MKFEPDGARWLTRLGLFNTQPFKRDEHSGYMQYSNQKHTMSNG